MYKILKNALICVIPLLLFVLCSCGKPAEDNTVSDITADERQKISDEYYKSHDQVTGCELYILTIKKAAYRSPKIPRSLKCPLTICKSLPRITFSALRLAAQLLPGKSANLRKTL